MTAVTVPSGADVTSVPGISSIPSAATAAAIEISGPLP